MVCEVGVMVHAGGFPDASLVVHSAAPKEGGGGGVLKDSVRARNLALGLNVCFAFHTSQLQVCV